MECAVLSERELNLIEIKYLRQRRLSKFFCDLHETVTVRYLVLLGSKYLSRVRCQ